MNDQAERAHAKKVRLMARLTWPIIVAALMLVMGPTQLDGIAKGLVLALMLGAVAALNVPSYEVIRRATREGAPHHLVMALSGTLALRLLAAVVVAGLLL